MESISRLLTVVAFGVAPSLLAAADQSAPAESHSKRPKVSKEETDGSARIGGHTAQEVLKLMGAKFDAGVTKRQLADYDRIFARVDANGDGKLTSGEYIDKGLYLTPRARAGIFRASDSDKDGVVTKREYLINRIITDEAKAIVQKMDTDGNGTVDRAEYLQNTPIKNQGLAVEVFKALDTDANGTLLIPEYLRVWGRWARDGKLKWIVHEGTEGDQSFVNSQGIKMVRIAAGSFPMGNSTGGDYDERPVRKVTISRPFYLSATEVTNSQYEQFAPSHRKLRGKLGFSKQDDEAVVFVSWHDAAAFCEGLAKREGKPYRLPTEAEWEYACRAGTTTAYHTGDSLPKAFHKNVRNSWFPAPTRSKADEIVPLIVAKTPANPWDLHDVHGNVDEWCADWYGPYVAGAQTDPVGYAEGSFRVTRGGSHSTLLPYLRSANRSGMLSDDKTWLVGFRVAMGEMPATKPLPAPSKPLNQRNVKQQIPANLANGPDPAKPYFKGPRRYVKIPPDSVGPLFSKHNHDPALVECPNGDLLAIWYTCLTEPGRELAIAASRLRCGAEEWDPASPFWDTPDRNDHAPAMWADGKGAIFHFNGLSAAGTWGSTATILRVSHDSGATWSTARLINPEHGLRHMPVESVFQTREGWIILPCDAVPGGGGGTAIHISKDGGKTWQDPSADKSRPKFVAGGRGGSIAGIHGGVTQLRDGRLFAFGRGDTIDGHMPKSISSDMGRTWTYSASEFPPIGGNQRLILMRLREGPLLFVSFTHDFFRYRRKPDETPPFYVTDTAGKKRRIYGMFAAISLDEGKTWPIKKPVTPGGPARTLTNVTLTGSVLFDETHAEPRGYLSACQTPDGVIHVISSGLHYAFNLAWIRH